MKFTLLFVLLFLFSTNCGLFKRDKKAEDASSEKSKIQKSSAFEPRCPNKGYFFVSVKCSSGNPACGTVPGSGNLEIYCIDNNDTILDASPFCCVHGEPCIKQIDESKDEVFIPYCTPFSSFHGRKVQKNTAFIPVCDEKYVVRCSSGNPVCGTLPGEVNLGVYCIDENDFIYDKGPFCDSGNGKKSVYFTCQRLEE